MADISTELQQILDAVYGEQVRGSIYRAIKLINEVSEVVISAGTDITSPTSSSTGYFEDSLYINTDTCDLWKCTGTDTWTLVGNLRGIGITSITKTGTSGLVDTYTITFSDGSTQTYTVTNGADGNKWYHGTTISGGAVLPTVYPTSGITKANAGDAYLNSSEGYVYVCITGGDANTATWSFNLALSGGGGAAALTDLNDVDIDATTLANKDILEFNSSTGKFENVSDRSFVRYAGSITFNDLMSGALSTYLTSAYEDMFFLVTDGGTLDSTTAAYWTGTYSAGDVIPPDSHIAVINIAPAGSTPSYRFDDFGGYVDISGKADKSEIIQWVSGSVSNATSLTLNDSRITANTKIACILGDNGTDQPVKYSAVSTGVGYVTITFPEATTALIDVGISNA